MKLSKRILSCLFAGFMLAAVGCNKAPEDDGENNPPVEVSKSFDNLEKDQVYMTELHDDEQTVRFQGMNYYLTMVGEEGNIAGVGAFDYSQKHFVEQDFNKIPESNITLYVNENDKISTAGGVQAVQNSSGSSSGRYWRMIEGGRYEYKIDILKMVYDRNQDIFGRLEVKAMRESFALTYEIWSPTRIKNSELFFDFSSGVYTQFSTVCNGRAAVISDGENGLAFIMPADNSVAVTAQGTGVRVTANGIDISANDYTGFGILVVPFTDNDMSGVENAIAREQLTVTTSVTSPEVKDSATTIYNAATGEYLIDGNIASKTDFTIAENRNAYDNFRIKFNNPTDSDITVPFAVLKNTTALRSVDRVFDTAANFAMSGMTPMLCTVDGIPVGIPVQTSKNWHSYGHVNTSTFEDVTHNYTGQWFVGTTEITVPANTEVTYDYKIAYENWGTAANVSHSQLSLIGWDMYTLWEQLALGSHGENICFYSYGMESGSWMQDIRPYLVTNSHGSMQEYNWSGNTGGGELLRYEDSSYDKQGIDIMYTDFVSQGSNITDVVNGGITNDGKIKMDVQTHLLRTDDVTRIIYNLTYTFLEETKFSRMTLFQYATERYQGNYFQKFAYGNSEGVIKDMVLPSGNNEFFDDVTEQKLDVEGEDQWFLSYDFNENISREETSAVMFTVREYKAELNGKTYTDPTVNFRKTRNGNDKQLTFELTTPATVGKTVEKGGKIEMSIEMVVLPKTTDTWYGYSDYMTATTNLFNTSEQGLQQAKYGAIEVAASVGNVKGAYPVVIEAASGETAAEFTLKGGLGYVPVRFTGLESYEGYELQVKNGSSWVKIDQSVKGNDFWQCDYSYEKGTYTLTYNVKNTVGTDYLTTNTYRLVQK